MKISTDLEKLLKIAVSNMTEHVITDQNKDKSPAVINKSPAVINKSPAVIHKSPAVIHKLPKHKELDMNDLISMINKLIYNTDEQEPIVNNLVKIINLTKVLSDKYNVSNIIHKLQDNSLLNNNKSLIKSQVYDKSLENESHPQDDLTKLINSLKKSPNNSDIINNLLAAVEKEESKKALQSPVLGNLESPSEKNTIMNKLDGLLKLHKNDITNILKVDQESPSDIVDIARQAMVFFLDKYTDTIDK